MDSKFIILILKMISKDFSGNELKVFCILLKHMNANFECYPSVRTISKQYGMSPTTVQKCINSLQEKKVIVKQNRKTTSNIYKIHKNYIVEKKKKKRKLLPSWFDKEIKEEKASDEEIKKLEESIKQIAGEE